ncbi:hypothetical protein lerEdw1_010161 [Lerista edwardsae]|nr:hypothetical protein lerEdw1_010161 [Lerista edwardsae]
MTSLNRKCASVKLTLPAARAVRSVPFAWAICGSRAVNVWVSEHQGLLAPQTLIGTRLARTPAAPAGYSGWNSDSVLPSQGLCDEQPTSAPRPALRSSMHNLMSPVPSLFRALMAISDNDPPMGWSILTLPVEEELRQNHANVGHLLLGPHTGLALPHVAELNATVPPCQSVFFNECLSMSRCRTACQSVGAWRYRWFHNACCQCVGPDCLGYGGAQPQCSRCRD